MNAANIALTKGLYAAFGRGDIASIAAACAPDIRWEVKGRPKDYPTIGPRSGRPGVLAFFQQVAETQEPIAFTQNEFHAADDTIVVLGHYKWIVRKTGTPVDADFVHIFTMKSGKVTAFREFTDTAQFAEAYRG